MAESSGEVVNAESVRVLKSGEKSRSPEVQIPVTSTADAQNVINEATNVEAQRNPRGFFKRLLHWPQSQTQAERQVQETARLVRQHERELAHIEKTADKVLRKVNQPTYNPALESLRDQAEKAPQESRRLDASEAQLNTLIARRRAQHAAKHASDADAVDKIIADAKKDLGLS